jgi:hypothetical protein
MMTNNSIPLPEDLHSLQPWFNVIRAARNAGRSGGCSILTLRILVDDLAQPILFGSPSVTRLMPRASARDNLEVILRELEEG